MKRLYFLLLFSIPLSVLGQNYSYLSTHGGSLSDHFLDVVATSDSGYAAVGVSSSFSASADMYMVKFDKNNAIEWSRVIGGPGIDWGYAIVQLPDSGFAIAGFSSSFSNGDFDGIIFRTNKLGLNPSHTLYGGSDWDFFYNLIPTNDTGFIACGKTYSGTNGFSDAWVVKLDKNLLTEWDLKYGGTDDECANKIIQTYDSNYVFCGTTSTYSFGNDDVWLVKLNTNGDTLFTRNFGDTLSEIGFSLLEHNIDSGLVIGGEIHSSTGIETSSDALHLKFSKSGQLMWYHALGPSTEDFIVYDLMQFPDGKLIACGKTPFGAGQGDVLNYITDQNGWWMPYSPTYGGVYEDYAKAMIFSLTGQHILAGSTESFGSGLFDGLIVVADSVSNNYTSLGSNSSDSLVGIESSAINNRVLVFPNPASIYLTISNATNQLFDKVVLYNLQGENVYSFTGNNTRHTISVINLSSGMYLAEIWTNGVPTRQPVIVQH